MMGNAVKTCGIALYRAYRIIFLLFLAVVAVYPVIDACADSLGLPSDSINYLYDSDDPVVTDELKIHNVRNSGEARKISKYESLNSQSLLQHASIKENPARLIKKIQDSADDLKSSQICPPVSSDLSPPAII